MAAIIPRIGKDGTITSYKIRVSLGRNSDGKKQFEDTIFKPDPALLTKKTPAAREREINELVKKFAEEFESQVLNGIIMDGRKTSLKEFSEKWLTDYAPQHIQPRTLEGYKYELEHKIVPQLGHFMLTQIKGQQLTKFYSYLLSTECNKGKGYSYASVKRVSAVLSSVLTTAVEWELIPSNPCLKVRVPTQNEVIDEEVKCFTPEQTISFLEYISKPYATKKSETIRHLADGTTLKISGYDQMHTVQYQLQVLFNLAVFTGCRKGELLALTWDDIDIPAQTVNINKSTSVVNNQQIIKSTKTKSSVRLISIPASVTAMLTRLKAEQAETKLSCGDAYSNPQGFLFTQDNGKQMDMSTPLHSLQRLIRQYNDCHDDELPVIPFHGLRHTSASLLISNGTDVQTVSKRLGHSSSVVTLSIYSHAFQKADAEAGNALESILKKQA